MQGERPVVAQFDKDKDNRLNATERREARTWLESQPAAGRGRGGGNAMTGSPGAKLTPADVKKYGAEPLYDPAVLRTVFLQFENDDWEKELGIFSNTDVEVPATLTVDGKVYKDVGVHFRGASSLMGVPERLEAIAQRDGRLGPRRPGGRRLSHAESAELACRSDVSADGAVPAGGTRLHSGAKGELHARGDQRRKLGHLRQRAAVQQGIRSARIVQGVDGRRALEGAGQAERTRRTRVSGRRSRAVQADLRDQVERQRQDVGGLHPAVQDAEHHATGATREGAGADARHRRRRSSSSRSTSRW